MNLLEKAREYQKSVNIAMEEYEEAKKAYDDMSKVESCFYVKVNNTNMDLREWDESINDLTDSIVQSFTTRRKNALEASEKRLAVLVGDEELFSKQNNAEGSQRRETEKDEVFDVDEEKEQETQNTKSETAKPWLNEETLMKMYIEEGLTAAQIAEKLGTKKQNIGAALHNFGIKKDNFKPGRQDYSKKKKSTPSHS